MFFFCFKSIMNFVGSFAWHTTYFECLQILKTHTYVVYLRSSKWSKSSSSTETQWKQSQSEFRIVVFKIEWYPLNWNLKCGIVSGFVVSSLQLVHYVMMYRCWIHFIHRFGIHWVNSKIVCSHSYTNNSLVVFFCSMNLHMNW